MQSLSDKNFGILISYIIPGFVVLHGLAEHSPTIAQWIAMPPARPRISGVVMTLIASLGVGLIASAVRWLIIDRIHHLTGVRPPRWDFSLLAERLDAFDALVISHYRYYQFYSNLLVSIIAWSAVRWRDFFTIADNAFLGFVLTFLLCVLFAGARDALKKYYARADSVLRRPSGLIVR